LRIEVADVAVGDISHYDLRANGSARAMDARGAPIPGLYAAGTDMASVMGGHYPAGGINLGPAMTFGYIAARHAAGATGYEYENKAARAKEGQR
jgi:succinate dehydrogenase/fumarate reductase flavoprotein subunit